MSCRVTLDRPWLALDFDTPHQVLSWSLNRPGRVMARRILWREVRNADLPRDLDVNAWLAEALNLHGSPEAVALLTSRDIRCFHDVTASVEGVTARCIATAGLSNAERVGARVNRSGKDWGTINLVLILDGGLTEAALLEALSIATQARTVAVVGAGLDLPTGRATGTGTDCIAIAAPPGDTAFAGLHTPLGEAIGQAVLGAVSRGVAEWMETVRREGVV